MRSTTYRVLASIAVIVAATIAVAISVYGVGNNPSARAAVSPPELLVYRFEAVRVNGTQVIPLFNRTIYPVRAMGSLYESLYGGKPKYIVGLYSDCDYAVLLVGDVELIVEKDGGNNTHYEYSLKLVFHNVTLMHYIRKDYSGLHKGLLEKLNTTTWREKRITLEGGEVSVLSANTTEISREIIVSKSSWECLDGEASYGTWIYFIPGKPTALIEPILYIRTDPGKALAAIFLLEEHKDNTAFPIQPSLTGDHTERLVQLAEKKGWKWVKTRKERLEFMLNGKPVIPISMIIPYKLVYDEKGVLEKIELTNTTLDCSCAAARKAIMQEENAFLIPPPIIHAVGRAVLIAPHDNPESMIELVLVHRES